MDLIKKVASHKIGVTAVVGAAAAPGAVEITGPIAVIAMAYIAGQTVVNTWGEWGLVDGVKRSETAVRAAPLIYQKF